MSATFLWAAARLRAAGAADVAAALLWAALTAAYAQEHDEQKRTQDDQQHCEPVCNKHHHPYTHTRCFHERQQSIVTLTVHDELDFTIRVP